MKKTITYTIALAGTLSLAGCGLTNDPGFENPDNDTNIDIFKDGESEVELSFWVYGADYESLVEEYVQDNPDTTINIRRLEKTDHHKNLFTSLSVGAGAPDVTAIDLSEIDTYKQAKDRFINLHDFEAEALEDDYLDWAWEIGTTIEDDFLIGLPAAIDPTVMYYRADVFEEAGLPSAPQDVEEHLQTWDDYEEAAQQILDETGKVISANPELNYQAKRDQAPEHYFNKEGELIIDDSPYVKNAFFETAEWMKNGYINDLIIDSAQWRTATADGSYATLIAPASMSHTIKARAPDATSWRMAPIPEGSGNRGGSWLSIPEESDHPKEAYEFLRWLTAPEQQQRSYEEQDLFPATPAVYEDEAFLNSTDSYFGGQETGQIVAEAALEAKPVYQGTLHSAVDEEITYGLINVYEGEDPRDEWADILTRVNRRISR